MTIPPIGLAVGPSMLLVERRSGARRRPIVRDGWARDREGLHDDHPADQPLRGRDIDVAPAGESSA